MTEYQQTKNTSPFKNVSTRLYSVLCQGKITTIDEARKAVKDGSIKRVRRYGKKTEAELHKLLSIPPPARKYPKTWNFDPITGEKLKKN